MILLQTILVLFILPFVDVTIYVYYTADSPSVELYDCILHEGLFYCRRPTEPIPLNRSNDTMQCYNNGTAHFFSDLHKKNISISTILHQWKSSLEKVEQYSRYQRNPREPDTYVCNCTASQSFGKNCEYLLPMGTTFEETLTSETSLKIDNPKDVQLYGDIVCYMTLECDSGLLCLDWRDICDGVQQCMLGLDEENCDKLEFNECENDEYRCMNGMCIPEEYFLDGEFDCLDWSDEIQYYNDTNCPTEEARAQCDDRTCPPDQFSCGDGQCIHDRFKFENSTQIRSECRSRREHYFTCETHYLGNMRTLTNGRCYEETSYEVLTVSNRSIDEQCEYLLKCALSTWKGKNCPCGKNTSCIAQVTSICPLYYAEYPKAGIIAPYVLFHYYRTRTASSAKPDRTMINGTIKCDGILTTILNTQSSYLPTLGEIEEEMCRLAKNKSLIDNNSSGQHCHQHSLSYNNQSYGIFDACNKPRKCISTYRIRDGLSNCDDKADEADNVSISTICFKMQRYRFRCSADEPTCLSVTTLGNIQSDCKNAFDEFWFGTSTKLADINCNKLSKDQCETLRQYIEKLWILNTTNQIAEQIRIPFRHYCDTFWNLVLKEDENASECGNGWVCPEEQWQCDSGQCIDEKWVLDGEWDCLDASDENDPNNQSILERNLKVVPISILKGKFRSLSKSSPFLTICDQRTEFSCIPVNFSNSLGNLTYNRPCIDRNRVGDDQIDCYGAIDERNTITHCNQSAMLGYNFQCKSSRKCIPYWNHCLGDRCTTYSDDQFWCGLRKNSSSCNSFSDSVCFNGTCVKNGRCNKISQCPFGEDEYMCEHDNSLKLNDAPYRKDKQLIAKNVEHKLRLIQFPTDSNITKPMKDLTSVVQATPTIILASNNKSAPIAYWCNRGVGVQMYNGSIVCFCPPQYYGDKCQFHTDRITLLLHLDLSQSIYTVNRDINIVLKILVLFLYNNDTITNHIFHVRPAAEMLVYSKKMIHFLYSRSSEHFQHKTQRNFNQSDILNDHPYSVRIEIYEMQGSGESVLTTVWQYTIYFDFLPAFRLAKVLRLTKPTKEQNPCLNNPCNQNQDCRQLINDKSKYACLCKGNFTGENCLMKDLQCIDGYCSAGSICKPTYRGLLIGNKLPYCICRFDRLGEKCDILYDKCSSVPCQNNGSCYSTSKPDTVSCICTEQYYGEKCELRKPEIKLHINESVHYIAAVVQYFKIDFNSLNLILVNQEVYRTLPALLEYRHGQKTAPEIVLVKLYSSQVERPAELYLISVHINVTTIYATTQVVENNQCVHIRTLISDNETEVISSYSPIKYHRFCQNNIDLLCFRDDFYLCICEENHSRVECFLYDSQLDQCSRCSARDRCLKGNRSRPNDFICLCPPCHTGTSCQLNSNAFVFSLDQLFFTDLTSAKQKITLHLLIIGPLLLALIALPNNVFSFLTFRRKKCLCNGIGQYLFYMSIINQISLSVLIARLIHLSITITGIQSHPIVDNILCKVLSYLLICFTRTAYWLISFVAVERVYTTIFLKGQWLKKPYVARRLIALTFLIVFISGAYELVFVKLYFFSNDGDSSMCVIQFPIDSQSGWIIVHQIVSIINSVLPLLINLSCTITIICIIIKSKMNIHTPDKGTEATEITSNTNMNVQEQQQNVPVEELEKKTKTKETHYRLNVLRDVLNDNREMITRPTITLLPSIFSLFSLPLIITSFSLGCHNIEHSPIRYALIAFYFISFVPQIITFFLYVYPSSMYFNEWRLTRTARWITALRQSSLSQNTIVLSTIKEETLKNLSESKY